MKTNVWGNRATNFIDALNSFLTPLELDLHEKSRRLLAGITVILAAPVLIIFSILHLGRQDSRRLDADSARRGRGLLQPAGTRADAHGHRRRRRDDLAGAGHGGWALADVL